MRPRVLSRRIVRAAAWGAWSALAVLPGCSAEWYRRSADDEVAAILAEGRKAELGIEAPLEVRQAPLEVGAVAKPGRMEDLKRTPAPQPIRSLGALPGSPEPEAKPGPEPPSGPAAKTRALPETGLPEARDAEPGEGGPEGNEPRKAEVKAAPPEGVRPPPPEPGAASPRAPDQGSGGPESPGTAGRETSRSEAAPTAPAVSDAPGAPGSEPARGAGSLEVLAQVLNLEGALRIAFANNRAYQSRKEAAYLSALSLTLARHNFAPRFFGISSGDYASDGSGRSGSLDSSFGFNLLLANGARLSINLANSLLKYFTGDRREAASSLLRGTLTQPLLRGFGTRVAREPLTQAERNVVYQIRDLERFRRELAVQILSEYYRVLQTRDRVTNEYNNWQSLVTSRDRVEALADAERVPRYQVDQARQQEFQAQNNWIDAVANYEATLDRFKITLGIPTDTPIALDQSELERLEAESVESMPIFVETAVKVALSERLDLRTARDQVEDAERKVVVARDALQMQLDLVATASAPSASEPGGPQLPLKFESGDLTYGFGFDLDLPLDRKAERNAYVSALISLDRARRDLSLSEDNIRLAVRDAYRRLEREIATFKIQKASVALAEQRVESTSYLLQAGRAQTRDLLESQSALLAARNSLTAALINYATAREEFLLEIEALRVDEEGRIGSIPLGGPVDHD